MLTEQSLLDVLEALGCGGLILDHDGRVLQTNDKARRYLGSVLKLRHGSARSGSSSGEGAIQAALREALRASTQVLPQLGSFITVPRENSRPLLLRRILIPGNVDAEEAATAALILLDMEDCPEPDGELLRDVFLLTRAEIRLAKRLSCGESLSEIADRLGVSVATLRVQLKTLFQKTGTSRQGQLVSLLAHLSRVHRD
jgi:DNA-binding CsgD family transcriptional regulator